MVLKLLLKRKCCSKLFSFLFASNLLLALILEVCSIGVVSAAQKIQDNFDDEGDEFAEFEDDEDQVAAKPTAKVVQEEIEPSDKTTDEVDATVEDDDDEEFESVEPGEQAEQTVDKTTGKKSDLKITKVPLHLRSNWESYYIEFLMIAGLVVYFINFIAGRNKNHKIATTWFDMHKDILQSNFSLVGDDGKKEIENPGLVKETESVFTLWCSGRVFVDGLLAELRLVKRQDIVSVLMRWIKPVNDQLIIKVQLTSDAMDTFVFCIANKKTAPRLSKELNDISTFCPERKSPEKYGLSGNNLVLLNEIGEAASVLLDSKVTSLLKKYEDCIDYIHFSDQYSGVRLPEDTQPIKLPDVKKMLIFSFNFPNFNNFNAEDMEKMKPLLQLVFYSIDKVKRFRLSREGKLKAEKNRQKVEELFLKTTHAQRQELAQMKREEKKRAEKEKMLNEEDPEKQRKWEEKEYRREMKKKGPKMKQLKVKAM